MSESDLVSLEVASTFLGKTKQTLRRWDEDGKLESIRGANGYRLYDFNELAKFSNSAGRAKPFVKWAGGKTQLLPQLLKRVPETYERYLEPFVGGGALFFALNPPNAILNDVNSELITCYTIVRDRPDELLRRLLEYQSKHSEEFYYAVRSTDLEPGNQIEVAARFIYLNKTCFNGLYRVNREGRFNVPIGRYKNPIICDEKNIRLCSKALQGVTLTNLDYKTFLDEHARSGDFVYLDPPYVPASEYSDFDRYSRGKFRVGNHVELCNAYTRLVDLGAHALLSNSETPLAEGLYSGFEVSHVLASRAINKKAERRGKVGEILVQPSTRSNTKFPSSRYMGSKTKLLPFISSAISGLNIGTVLDGFSGSGVVSYHFKRCGYSVISNDFLRYSASISKAIVENSSVTLSADDIQQILKKRRRGRTFIQDTFKGLYFSDEDNQFLDRALENIQEIECEYKRAIALSALSRACLKRRPRGLFTYVGFRYDDGRKDLAYSVEEHFLFSVAEYNAAVFCNGRSGHASLNSNFLDIDSARTEVDLVYLDPPYFSKHSDNDYTRRYHFIEGLCRNWEGIEIQEHTKTKKFKKFESPFDTKQGTYDAFESIFDQYRDKALLISYSSNSLPTKDEMVGMLEGVGKSVDVIEIDYSYSFGNQGHKVKSNNNSVQEYLFLAT